ncbi:alkali metal cation/H+ antiporter Nha1 C terminus-domain-containing protein [Podospora australis]|uniref:Alkali metal cation/H+ antiporter Nha1 C terminus-domain-containing protein n=1 Tax=Podospora australis TaxID=1536484 RepID=A0AAN7AIF1_9PEZI|nr:alkali metal cation/H+ antiporter Nha1 C terminus-domain-containing protein [Podospora australis]
MVWDHLSVTGPHLIYLILGGFTTLFMLCSTVIKERMYIGEATVATLCGVIFGPHAANVIDPINQWSSVDIITIEFSRIVLVVQCFAVGVELPKFYMERHWKSVTLLLIPVMLFGWLVTSLFVWWMIPPLNWIESLVVAACVTATDPVLASSVVGKGKFAKRVPKHLRDLLSAESGCNDGMAFPFVYLALYLIHDKLNAKQVTKHWIVYTILYECVFGAIYGFAIGYLARHGIKYAERHDLIDRESFLVFYFVLALFAAGSGSILGIDDLLVGFAAGVGFSNDGWFTQKTEESHVSNVIDLLINLTYFVYFGTIIPWPDFNDHEIGLYAWRLVVLALLVIFFRRIPIMLALKPIIPDIKTWREALFAGHFGPIGVGAIFVAMLARAELETESPIPLTKLPDPDVEHYKLIRTVWPIVAFLVVASIIVHGSSVAVFTLGKHINTLSITMSYTQANEDGPSWMTRLPRITSTSRSQARMSDTEVDEYKMPEYPPGTLPPIGYPGNFLRRVKEDDEKKSSSRHGSRTSSLVSKRRRKKWDDGIGPGGPITQSAIFPQRRSMGDPLSPIASPAPRESSDQPRLEREGSSPVSPTEAPKASPLREEQQGSGEGSSKTASPRLSGDPGEETHGPVEVYDEGDNIVIETKDGDVLAVQPTQSGNAAEHAKKLKNKLESEAGHHGWNYNAIKKRVSNWRDEEVAKRKEKEKTVRKGEPARAYQFGTTIIVENEDGDVVKKYELPAQKAQSNAAKQGGASNSPKPTGLTRWTSAFGRANAGESSAKAKDVEENEEKDDKQIRFTIGGVGRRMTKEDFLNEVQKLDKSTRREVVDKSSASPALKNIAKQDPQKKVESPLPSAVSRKDYAAAQPAPKESPGLPGAQEQGGLGEQWTPRSGSPEKKPVVINSSAGGEEPETDAERRRRMAALHSEESGEVGEEEEEEQEEEEAGETAAERRRREAALGMASDGAEDDSEDDDTPRVPPAKRAIRFVDVPDRGRK